MGCASFAVELIDKTTEPGELWEPHAFASVWRLPGHIDTTTRIPGATAVGTPGMAGGISLRAIRPNGCEGVEPTPQVVVTDAWLFQFNGAAEMDVEHYDSRSFRARGWVVTDATAEMPAVQVDIDVDVTW